MTAESADRIASIGGLSIAVTLFGRELLKTTACAQLAWELFLDDVGIERIAFAGSQVSWNGVVATKAPPTARTVATAIKRVVGTGARPKASRELRAGGGDARYFCARGASGMADTVQLCWPAPAARERADYFRQLFEALIASRGVDYATAGFLLPRAPGTFAPSWSSVGLARRYVGIELWNELVDAQLFGPLPARGVGWLTAVPARLIAKSGIAEATLAGARATRRKDLFVFETGPAPTLAEVGGSDAVAHRTVFDVLRPLLLTKKVLVEDVHRCAVVARTQPWPVLEAFLALERVEQQIKAIPAPGSAWAWDPGELPRLLSELEGSAKNASQARTLPVVEWLPALPPAWLASRVLAVKRALDAVARHYPEAAPAIDAVWRAHGEPLTA